MIRKDLLKLAKSDTKKKNSQSSKNPIPIYSSAASNFHLSIFAPFLRTRSDSFFLDMTKQIKMMDHGLQTFWKERLARGVTL
jgi:hypothetical protein